MITQIPAIHLCIILAAPVVFSHEKKVCFGRTVLQLCFRCNYLTALITIQKIIHLLGSLVTDLAQSLNQTECMGFAVNIRLTTLPSVLYIYSRHEIMHELLRIVINMSLYIHVDSKNPQSIKGRYTGNVPDIPKSCVHTHTQVNSKKGL